MMRKQSWDRRIVDGNLSVGMSLFDGRDIFVRTKPDPDRLLADSPRLRAPPQETEEPRFPGGLPLLPGGARLRGQPDDARGAMLRLRPAAVPSK